MPTHTDDVLKSIVDKVKGNLVTLLFALPAFGVMTGWIFKDLSAIVELDYGIALRSFSVLYFSLPLLVLALSLLPIRNIQQNTSILFRRYFKAEFICFFILIHLLGTLSNQSFIIEIVFALEFVVVLFFLWKYNTTLRAADEAPVIGILLILVLSIAFLGFPWDLFSNWNVFPIISIIGVATVLYSLFIHQKKAKFKEYYSISFYAIPNCATLLLIIVLSVNFNNPFIAIAPDLPDDEEEMGSEAICKIIKESHLSDGRKKLVLFQNDYTYKKVFQNYKAADSISKIYQWVINCESDIRRLANLYRIEKELTILKSSSGSKPIIAKIENLQRKHNIISGRNILESIRDNKQLEKEAFYAILNDPNKRDLLLNLETIMAVLKEPSTVTADNILKSGGVPLTVLLAHIQWRGIFIFGLSFLLLVFYRISKREKHSQEKLQSIDASILILCLLILPLFIPIKEEIVNTKDPYWFITLPNWYLPGTVGNILNPSTPIYQRNTYVQEQDWDLIIGQFLPNIIYQGDTSHVQKQDLNPIVMQLQKISWMVDSALLNKSNSYAIFDKLFDVQTNPSRYQSDPDATQNIEKLKEDIKKLIAEPAIRP